MSWSLQKNLEVRRIQMQEEDYKKENGVEVSGRLMVSRDSTTSVSSQ